MKKLPPEQKLANRRKSWRDYFWRNREKKLAAGRRLEIEHKSERRAKRAAYYRLIRDALPVEKRRELYRMAYRRKANRPQFVVMSRCRSRIANTFLGIKNAKTLELLGCTPEELKNHIELQFKPGMSWENRSDWHIDHKRPISSFDLLDESQRIECFHFSNLQPLWKAENLAKSNKIISFEAAA